MTATMEITPDEKNPTATSSTMKSGYGINETVTFSVFDLSIQVQQLFQKFFNDLSRRTETQTFSWTVIDKFNNRGELIAGNIFK